MIYFVDKQLLPGFMNKPTKIQGSRGIRTPGLLLTRQTLCQLSYRAKWLLHETHYRVYVPVYHIRMVLLWLQSSRTVLYRYDPYPGYHGYDCPRNHATATSLPGYFSSWLAQSVEHQTLNLRVEGSSPSLGDFFGLIYEYKTERHKRTWKTPNKTTRSDKM